MLDPFRGDGRFFLDGRQLARRLDVDVDELLNDLVDVLMWALMSIWILISFGLFCASFVLVTYLAPRGLRLRVKNGDLGALGH